MKATQFTRDDCQLGPTRFRITYRKLIARYVCNACGKRLTIRFGDNGWHICCAECGGHDFITESQFVNECVDAHTVKQGLPEHLLALVQPERIEATPQQAIADLVVE